MPSNVAQPAPDNREQTRQAAESRHYWMLADERRTRRFRKAIHATVQPGDVAIDVGTGTGILAMFAVQAGARRVYALEHCPETVAIARELIARNGMAGRIEVIHTSAAEAELPEAADVLICELIGNLGSEEDIEAVAAAVAARHLKPHGRCVPSRLRCYAVPVQEHPTPEEVFRAGFHGLDVRLETGLGEPQPGRAYPELPRPRRLGPSVLLEFIVVGRPAPADRTVLQAELPIARSGVLQSVLGYFEAELAPGVPLRSFPRAAGSSWTPYAIPTMPPQRVAPGDRFALTIQRLGFHTTHQLAAGVVRLT